MLRAAWCQRKSSDARASRPPITTMSNQTPPRGGLEVETRNDLSTAATPEPMNQTRWPSCLVWTLSLFAVFWVGFFVLYLRFPYIKNGSDVVFDAKLRWEASGPIFPADPRVLRLLI